MQAQQNLLYKNELECIRAILENEGWTGLFSRGLGLTLAREIPSYAIYFVVYRTLISTAMAAATVSQMLAQSPTNTQGQGVSNARLDRTPLHEIILSPKEMAPAQSDPQQRKRNSYRTC